MAQLNDQNKKLSQQVEILRLQRSKKAAAPKDILIDHVHPLKRQQIENQLRQNSIMQSHKDSQIEERLRNLTVSANMNLTQNKPKMSEPEQKFRDHVDNVVDIMSRYSVKNLKTKVDHQRQIDEYKRVMAQRQIMMTEQSKHKDYSKVQSINDMSTVALNEQHMTEQVNSHQQPSSLEDSEGDAVDEVHNSVSHQKSLQAAFNLLSDSIIDQL